MKDIAVITGDLIASTTAEPESVERAMQALESASARMTDWSGEDTRFTRFRGDGWQICLMHSGLVFRATLFLIATLRAAETGIETRMSVAIGPYDRLGEAGLSAANGKVFALSGQNLDNMLRSQRLVFGATDSPVSQWQRAVLYLAGDQANSWSREKAEVMTYVLDPTPMTQKQIAAALGITRQAVQARMKGVGREAVVQAMIAFESETR